MLVLVVIIGALFATFFASSVLHEVSHSLAGVLMGLRIEEVRVGSGPVLLRTGLGRTAVQLRLIPGRGKVQFLRPVGHYKRIRLFVCVAAGPACDVLLLLAFVAASRQPNLSDNWAIAAFIAIGAQGYWVISNLWPRIVEIDGSTMPSDGLQLWQLMVNRHAGTIESPGHVAIEHILYEGLISQYLRPGQSAPARSERSPAILNYYVARFANKESFGAHMRVQLDGALSANQPACEQLLLLDTLITATLPLIDAQALADLDRWSARAYELGSHIATVKASRGSILIEIGHPAEGLALLENATDGQAFNDCLVHAFRALGRFKLGDITQAEAEFSQARALFKHEDWRELDILPIVERIARTIGSEFKSPATWSAEAARAAFRNQTSGLPERPDRR